MKPKIYIRLIFLSIFISSMIFVKKSQGQIQSMEGPRIGVTLITPGESADYLNQHTGNPAFTTQYGWQWESRFASGTNTTGLVEWIAVIGGMEHGKFLPSVSSIVGYRTSDGFEMGFGPNLSVSGLGMVVAMGINYKVGELNIPVNIAWVPKKDYERGGLFSSAETVYFGSTYTLLVGFNMAKK